MTLWPDGRTLEHGYTISSHMSLQLRRAEKAPCGASLAYMFIFSDWPSTFEDENVWHFEQVGALAWLY